MSDWEMVIGLEVHCELQTATKLFCGCRNAFGDDPNVNICPVCLGLPGALPVLNEQAVELAMRIGQALHCEIRPSVFARKNYFYPDQAKDYQISQYDLPLNSGGWLELPDGFRVGVTRAHMEEDTGKLTHVGASGRINAAQHALVDYNRSGVPLVEIVSEPDIRTVEHARAYASELRGILVATGASDGRMEEGSMRVDANVSVRPGGTARSAPAARSRTSTRCARSGGPLSTRLPARSPCSSPGGPWCRRRGTGTSRPAARSRCARRRRPTTTATSPSPTSSRSPRTRPGGSGCAPAWGRCRPTAVRTWPTRSAGRRATPRWIRSGRWSTWVWTAWSARPSRQGRRRRWPSPVPPTRWRHRARQGCSSTPPPSLACSPWSPAASSRPPSPRRCSAPCSNAAAATRRKWRRRWASRPSDRTRWLRSSTR